MLQTKKEDEAKCNNTILVIGLDADGCVFNRAYISAYRRLCNRSFPLNRHMHQERKNALHTSNRQLFKHIVEQIRSKSYRRIVYLSSSLRQDAGTDRLNAIRNRTPLFSQALPMLADIFKENEGKEWATNI